VVSVSHGRRVSYVPDRGDIVWLAFDPQTGHEQAGRRPALVISPKAYNTKTNLAVFCPITSRIKGHPFEVNLPVDGRITGAVLSDQIKSLDWKIRDAKFVLKVSPEILALVVAKVRTLIA
jgi:mRNA interferase MazF